MPSMNQFHRSEALKVMNDHFTSLFVQRKDAANASVATLTKEMRSRLVTLKSMPFVAGKGTLFSLHWMLIILKRHAKSLLSIGTGSSRHTLNVLVKERLHTQAFSQQKLRRGDCLPVHGPAHVDDLDPARAEVVRWVSESNRPFRIVVDRGFLALMKTGRPHMYVPKPTTVASDVRMVFTRTRQRIAAMLQVSQISLYIVAVTPDVPRYRMVEI